MGGVTDKERLGGCAAQRVEDRLEALGPGEGVGEQGDVGFPTEAGQLGTSRGGVLVGTHPPPAKARDELCHAGERLGSGGVVGRQVGIQADTQPLALLGNHVAPGHLGSGHTQCHERCSQRRVGVHQGAIQVEDGQVGAGVGGRGRHAGHPSGTPGVPDCPLGPTG